ncbi:hypothetical protein FQR65_LT10217 [Abscondita terminalis]|nr:hypothetical protein FQR65_LT10217 [Abscondita terminalis]
MNNSFGQLNLIDPKSGVTKTFPLQVGINIVGSGQQAHIQIYKNDILPIHFSLEVHKNKMVVVSTFSNMNPTYLNDKRLRKGKSELVKPSDVINFSNLKAVYENNLIQDQDLKQFQQLSKNSKFFSTPRRSNILIGGCFRTGQKIEKQNSVSKSNLSLSSSQPDNTNTKTINRSPKHFNNLQYQSEQSLPMRKSQRKSVQKIEPTTNISDEYFLNIASKQEINSMNKDVNTSTLQNETLPFGFNVSLCSDNIENDPGASIESLNSDECEEKYRTPKAAPFFAPLMRSSLKKSHKTDDGFIPNNMNNSEARSLYSKSARSSVLRNSAGNIITRLDRRIVSPSNSNCLSKRKKSGSASPLSLPRSKRYKIFNSSSRASLNGFESEKLTNVIKPFKSENKFQKHSNSSLYEDTNVNTPTITSDSFIFETPTTFQQNTIVDANISGINVLESSLQSSIIDSERSEYDSNANKDYWSPIYCSTTGSFESELDEYEANDLNSSSIRLSLINSNETETRKIRAGPKGSMNELSFKSVSNLTHPIKDLHLKNSTEEDLEVCSGSALYSEKLIYPISSSKGNIYENSENVPEESTIHYRESNASTFSKTVLRSGSLRSKSCKVEERHSFNVLVDFTDNGNIGKRTRSACLKLLRSSSPKGEDVSNGISITKVKNLSGNQTWSSENSNSLSHNTKSNKTRGISETSKYSKQRSSLNDLSDLKGLKRLIKTPKFQRKPIDDLTDIKGVKQLLKTPIVENKPRDDLSDVEEVKQLFNGCKKHHSPNYDLTNVNIIKNLLRTPKPQKEQNNDLCDVTGVKQLFVTQKIQHSPRNDLTDIKGVKKLLKTPKPQKAPNNDLCDVTGVKQLFVEKKIQPSHVRSDIKGVRKLLKTPKPQKAPNNDLCDVTGVKQLFVEKKIQPSPRNDLTDIKGVKKLLKTPKPQKEPNNDLSDVTGVKQLFVVQKIQPSPRNDLTDIKGVKKLLKTPKPQKEPNNDLRDVTGVKQLFVAQKIQPSPRNDLTDIKGVKKLLKTPKLQKEPNNDLSDVTGVKQLFVNPKKQRSPNNDLTDVKGIKKLFKTLKPKKELFDGLSHLTGVNELLGSPRAQRSSRDELSNVEEVEEQLHTPNRQNDVEEFDESRNALINILGERHTLTDLRDVKTTTTSFRGPQTSHTHELSELSENNFSDVEPVRLLFSYNKKRLANIEKCTTAKKFKSSYVREADYTDVGGVKRMFAEEEANYRAKMNLSGVSELFRDEFDKLIGKEPLRQYPGKNSPTKLELFANDKFVLNSSPSHNSHVEQWIAEQNKSLPNTSTPITKKGSYECLSGLVTTNVQIDVNMDQLITPAKGQKGRSYSKQVDEKIDNSAVKTRMRTRGANKNMVEKIDQTETDHIGRVTRGRKVEDNFDVKSYNEKTFVQTTRRTRGRILTKENVELKSSSKIHSEDVENESSKQKSAFNQNVKENDVYVDLVSTRTRGRHKRIDDMKTSEIEVKPIKRLRKRKEELHDNSIIIVASDNTSVEIKEISKSVPSRTLRSTKKKNSTKNEIIKKKEKKLDDFDRVQTLTLEKPVKKRTTRGTQKKNHKHNSPIVDILNVSSLTKSTPEIFPNRRTRKQISKIESALVETSESSSKNPKPNDKKVKFADNFVETHTKRKRDIGEVEMEEVLTRKKQKSVQDPMEMKRKTRNGARKLEEAYVNSEELKMPKRKSNRKK